MISFVLVSLPVFFLIALGFIAVKLRLIAAAAIEVLGAFSFRFALPALVLRLIASEPLSQSFNLRFFVGYLASGCLIFALVFVMSRLFSRQGPPVAAARATTSTVSNLGFLGPPILLAYFGPSGAGPLATAIICEVMILLSVGAVIMAGSENRSSNAALILLKGIIYNPVIVAIAVGGSLSASEISLPVPLNSFLALLGAAAAPTALFAVGAALASRRIDLATGWTAAAMTLSKLVIYPLTVWCVLSYILRLEPFWIGTGVLLASLPSAGSNYVLAQRYAADADQVSAGIVFSTVISALTVPWIGWLVARS